MDEELAAEVRASGDVALNDDAPISPTEIEAALNTSIHSLASRSMVEGSFS